MTSKTTKSAKLAGLIKKTAQKLVDRPKHLQKLALTLPLLALFVEEVRAAQGKSAVFEDLQALTEFVDAQNLDDAQYAEIEESLDGVELAANDVTEKEVAAVAEEETEKAAILEEEGGATAKRKAALLEPGSETGAGRGFAAEAESGAAGVAGEHAAAGATETFELAGLVVPVAPLPLLGTLAAGIGLANANTGGATNTETATGTTLSRTLKQLKTDGIAIVQPASGSNVINVELGTGAALISTTGVTLFGDTDRDCTVTAAENAALQVNLIITSADQLAEVAALTGLTNFGIDSVRIDLSNQDLLNALTSDATLAQDLAAIRASGLTVTTIDMGAAASITEAQAATLLANGLAFAADDNITVTEDAGSAHLSTTLKDLHKLGVDAVSVAGTDHLSVDMGDLTTADLASGNALPTFDSALNVTLDVTEVSQFSQATDMVNQLLAAHIDNVDMLVAADSQGEYAPAFTALSENTDFRTDILTMRNAGLNPGLDFGGKDVAANILVDEVSVTNLIADGLHFAANDHLTMQVVGHSSSTHLSSSLKDLQKLGIDTVAVASTGNIVTDSVVVDSGGVSSADLANGAVLPQFDSALNVTLSVADSAEFNASSGISTQLHNAGIDNVEVVLDVTNQATFDASYQSFINDASFTSSVASLASHGISTGIDLGGADVSAVVTINETIAHNIAALNLHYASNDVVIFNEALTAAHTHLSTSIKDLQKLGVDAVTVTGSDAVHVTLGTSNIDDLATVPLFLHKTFDSNGQPVFSHLDQNVTLDVGSSTAEFHLAADSRLAPVLHTTHIDNVKFDITDTGATGFADDLLALANTTTFTADVAALHNNLLGVELDLGGASTQGAISINEQQADALIAAGVHFSAADHVTLNATGTYHSAHMSDLTHLGVDVVEPPVVQSLQLSSLSSALHDTGTSHLDVFDTQLNIDATLLSQLDNFDWSATQTTPAAASSDGADLNDVFKMVAGGVDVLADVRLDPQATWGDLINTLRAAGLGNVELETTAKVHISDDLSAALYESGMLHALPEAGIAIDAGANKVLNTTLKAMADLGVDSVNADHKVYVELGLKPEDVHTLADLGDLFSAFGLDSAAPDTHLFGAKGAGLVVDQATFDNFNKMDPASVQTLLGDLNKLGFTEVDVVGSSAVEAVYEIKVTAQTPVLSQVAIIGSDTSGDLAHVFDPDILHKPVK